MAYPVPDQVRQELPANGGGVTDAKLAELIQEGVDLVTGLNVDAEENSLSRRAVYEYAIAEALRIMRNKGDRIAAERIDSTEARATRFMDEYRASTATTDDDSGYRPKMVVEGTPW